jgi:hypothetical protein
LQSSFGEQLISIINYGANVDSESDRPVGNGRKFRVLIVVKQLDSNLWDSASNAFDRIKGRTTVAPMLMTDSSLKASTDVFPITFLEMRQNYKVLFGEDVLKDLEIQQTHLRLRCEQELKNLLLRMQSTCLMHHASPKRLKNALNRNFESFLRLISGVAWMSEKQLPGSEESLLDWSVKNFQLNPETLHKVRNLVGQKGAYEGEWIRALYIEMMSTIEKIATSVDRMPEEVLIVNPASPEVQ